MKEFKSKYISIIQNGQNQFEIELNNGDYSLNESDFIKIDGESYHLKTFRIGEVYTKDNGSIDATLEVKEYFLKKSEVEDFVINNTSNNIQLSIRLKNKTIELVRIKNEEKYDENITKLAIIIINGKL